jgi:beta-xylosidase
MRAPRLLILVTALTLVAFGFVEAGSDRWIPAPGGAGIGAAMAAAPQTVPLLGPATVVEEDDVGDPFVLPIPGVAIGEPNARYVLFWTTDWQSNVPTAVSADLTHWRRVADALPVLPSWAVTSRTMTWAPSATRVSDGWVLYFSTEDAASQRECIGRAFSHDPTGPFVDTSPAPLICQVALGGSIDPSVVRRPGGTPTLVWKSDGNSSGKPVGIWEQQLTGDGLSVVGTPIRLLAADQAWERGIVEGPAMLAATGGGWWLFYSGGTWQSNTYNTGLAWCASLAGPCRKSSNKPLLVSTPTAVSPGGLETFVDNNGKLWASYSAFPSPPANAEAAMESNRVLEIAPILSY